MAETGLIFLPNSFAHTDCHYLRMSPVSCIIVCTGRAKNNNALGKIRYVWNCSKCKFFNQIHSVYNGGFRPYILQISLQYFIAFRNYKYLNLNVHFSK